MGLPSYPGPRREMVPAQCQPRAGAHIALPQFHIVGAMRSIGGVAWPGGLNDVNAIFEDSGVYHAMHQEPVDPDKNSSSGPHAWAHLVSTDLVRWRKLAPAIAPTGDAYDAHDGDCDGAVSFPGDQFGPTMLFGPDCGRPLVTNDAARVAVARPANLSDPFMERWVKDKANPVVWADGKPCSFAGRVWRRGDTMNMLCLSEQHTWARYTSASTSLHGPWNQTDPSFATWHGHGPPGDGHAMGSLSAPSFFPLVRRASTPVSDASHVRSGAASAPPTHMINGFGGRGFWVGSYDAAREKLELRGAAQMVEASDSPANWFVSGEARSDGRVLHLGWMTATPAGTPGCNSTPGGGWDPFVDCTLPGRVCALTSVRVLTYDDAAGALLAFPAAEYASLRNSSLLSIEGLVVAPRAARKLPLPEATGAAMDVEVEVDLADPAALAFTLEVLASPARRGASDHRRRATSVTVRMSGRLADGSRRGNLTVLSTRLPPNGTYTRSASSNFSTLRGEASLGMRVLVDRSIVEAFAAGGRAVVSARDYPAEDEAAAWVSSEGAAATRLSSVRAWSMGCGWESMGSRSPNN